MRYIAIYALKMWRFLPYSATESFSVFKSGTFFGCWVCVHDFRNIKEEIVVQQFGDAYQYGEVDTLPLEHLVNNTVVAVDGFREPPHRAPLRPQLCPYHPANMYFLLIYGHIKIVNFDYPWLRFCNTLITNKKAHDCSRAFSSFFIVIR